MNTVIIAGITHKLVKITTTDLFTAYAGKVGKYGADIYASDKTDDLVLVATIRTSYESRRDLFNPNCRPVRKHTTTISERDYNALVDATCDNGHNFTGYHIAIMARLGFV
jgi:hypothetical protein